jgi:hypothetical protein
MRLQSLLTLCGLLAGSAALGSAAPLESPRPDPLARRLCDALHALPQSRRAECCGQRTGSSLADECARTLSASLADRAVRLEVLEVDRCVAAASRALEGCDWVGTLAPLPPEACRAVIHGQLTAGARCRSALECGDGLACRGVGPTSPGVCSAPAPAGASCTSPADTLASEASQSGYEEHHPDCSGFCQKGRCTAFVAVGGACLSNAQCAPGTHCALGRCAAGPEPVLALKAGGETCSSAFECKGSCLKAEGAAQGVCGMQCNSWPPAGYTPPVYASPSRVR